MKIQLICITLIFAQCILQSLHARTLYVGAGAEYATLEDVQDIIQPNDVIEIMPGIYRQCASFNVDNITIRPKGWPDYDAKPRFQDVTCEGKAIFVINGDNIRIDAIEFVNAKVIDRNDAGILFNGGRLFVYDSYFYNNEVGVMTGNERTEDIVVDSSVFESNGNLPPHWGHGLYVGSALSVKVKNSLFIKTKAGHHIKSRALYTEVIGNEISDGADGNASYSIDISNGGNVLVADNIMQKGPYK